MLESSIKILDHSVSDKDDHRSSIIEVSSSVPAFVGYTEITTCGDMSFLFAPIKVSSMAEFCSIFGEAPQPVYTLADAQESEKPDFECCGRSIVTKRISVPFMLYYQMQMFFANGGGDCFVVSVGNYSAKQIEYHALKKGVDALLNEKEATILVCPEAIALTNKIECYQLQTAMISHCGLDMHNRIAILDVYDGHRSRSNPVGDPVNEFRNYIGYSWLDYAAAYYPWVDATVVKNEDISWQNIDLQPLLALLELEKSRLLEARRVEIDKCIALLRSNVEEVEKKEIHQKLMDVSTIYSTIICTIVSKLNVLPPSAAMAGIYNTIDHDKGVWKAPANVALKAVSSAVTNLSHDEQEDLNFPLAGKPLNAIRSFYGQGVLVWGARTLNGNSVDWKYIHVRRTIILIEESVKQTVALFADYPNSGYLWVTLKEMINDYLFKLWKRGGLVGLVAEDAFKVFVGLGETMSTMDINDGLLKILIYVALSKPGEFVEIVIDQKMIKQDAGE